MDTYDDERMEESMEEFERCRLTINEMREILVTQEQEREGVTFDTELHIDKETGLIYINHFFAHSAELVYDHLMVELLFQNRDKVDWKHVTNCYDFEDIKRIDHLLSAPLLWVSKESVPSDLVVVGKVAKEVTPEWRYGSIMDWYCEMNTKALEWFAETMPVAEDVPRPRRDYHRLPEDMILWDRLFADMYSQKPRVSTLRNNLKWIASKYGGTKAVEIVQRLREDWADILLFKLFGFNEMEPAKIEEFRIAIFEGMDRNLRIWQNHKTIKTALPTCRYIDFDKLAQNGIYTPEQFTTMLRQACEQDAKALAAFLTKYFKMGSLDFHGDSKKKIYEHLKECFPGTIKYSYPNFTQYFN